jgi:hypothetical protein
MHSHLYTYCEPGTFVGLCGPHFSFVKEVEDPASEMQSKLVKCDSSELPEVIRVAAIAGLLVISKYYALTDDNEVYRIAISTSFCSSLIDFKICLTYLVCIVSYVPRQENSVV